MCGIVGIVKKTGAPVDPQELVRMLGVQAHRGPDGSGIACAKLGDARGYFGRAAQSILVEPRKG